MKDYLFYNTAKEAIDLKKYSGRYNLYLLCRKGQVCFHISKKRIEANSWDLVVWPSSRRFDDVSFKEGTDADVLLVSDYFLNLNKPETPWDVPGSNYLKTHPVLPPWWRMILMNRSTSGVISDKSRSAQRIPH